MIRGVMFGVALVAFAFAAGWLGSWLNDRLEPRLAGWLRRKVWHWQHALPWNERDRLRQIVGDSDRCMSTMCRHGHHHGPCFGCSCICHETNAKVSWSEADR